MSYTPGCDSTELAWVGMELPSLVNKLEIERAELDALLSSEMFGRTNHHARFLTYVCNMYFAGAADAIKEYSIAVEALGRPKDFDPQTDTIVRVTAHALRKRLEDYYRTTGADHPVQICLPSGHYVPKFIHRNGVESGNGTAVARLDHADPARSLPHNGDRIPEASSIEPLPQVASARENLAPSSRRPGIATAAIALVAICGLGLVLAWPRWQHKTTPAPAAVTASGNAIHALVGDNREPYSDHAGILWQADKFCTGGASFAVSGHTIQGTADPALFSAGRHGNFQCRFPVPQGVYEVRLLFAETAGLQENTRNVSFAINGGPSTTFDVVDDASGDDIAIEKVIADVTPDSSGAIRLDFSNPDSFLNAVEIVPSLAHSVLPVRITAGRTAYRDSSGNLWLPDRYSFGGRPTHNGGDLSNVTNGGIYEWQRIGHFHYVIPVAMGHTYTLKLHFREHWFGAQNGNIGGVGSRIFDVSCNGSMLLKNFDILAAGGSEPLIKSFPHIQPTAQGKIEIYFTPVVNYPSINAVEVIPE
jgi:hypothetical protein